MKIDQQQRQSQHGEHHLARHLERQIDGHTGAGRAEGNASQGYQASPDKFAADLGDRQQGIDAFADQTQAEEGRRRRKGGGKYHGSPGLAGTDHLRDVQGDHRNNPPSGRKDRLADLVRPAHHHQTDDDGQADERADDDRCFHETAAIVIGKTISPARKALKRRATSAGLTVGRPSLFSEPGVIWT